MSTTAITETPISKVMDRSFKNFKEQVIEYLYDNNLEIGNISYNITIYKSDSTLNFDLQISTKENQNA